jgi:hypothetical protein
MPKNNPEYPIIFFADKIHVHRWPLNSSLWNQFTQEKIDLNLNKNIKKKKIMINVHQIKINDYDFDNIKKVGITVPLFKKQFTMVFEGHFEDFDAHIHVTSYSQNYLKIFNNLMSWKNKYFPE